MSSRITPERLAALEAALLDDEHRTNGEVMEGLMEGLGDLIDAVKGVTLLLDSYPPGDRVSVDSVRRALYGP